MKKKLVYTILIITLLTLTKYYLSNYTISYKVDNYDVKEVYKNKRFYIEIKDDKYTYNFDLYKKRKLSKTKITKIKTIEEENLKCIYPTIKNVETYPLCYENGIYTDYNQIENELLDEYKVENIIIDKKENDFSYKGTLSNDEYVALWNYKGYILMNGKNFEYINVFDKDHYDNTLSYLYGNTIYMADYNAEHEFNILYKLNLETKKISTIDIGYDIDFDSYFVGAVKNNIYLFDNKHAILYEINTKKEEVNIKSDNETGYEKYEDGKFISCSKAEYKINKITYDTNDSIYKYEIKDNQVFKSIKENKLKQLIFKYNINLLKENNSQIYYYYNNMLYKYIPSEGSNEIFYEYELEFNSNNRIFIYNK